MIAPRPSKTTSFESIVIPSGKIYNRGSSCVYLGTLSPFLSQSRHPHPGQFMDDVPSIFQCSILASRVDSHNAREKSLDRFYICFHILSRMKYLSNPDSLMVTIHDC